MKIYFSQPNIVHLWDTFHLMNWDQTKNTSSWSLILLRNQSSLKINFCFGLHIDKTNFRWTKVKYIHLKVNCWQMTVTERYAFRLQDWSKHNCLYMSTEWPRGLVISSSQKSITYLYYTSHCFMYYKKTTGQITYLSKFQLFFAIVCRVLRFFNFIYWSLSEKKLS